MTSFNSGIYSISIGQKTSPRIPVRLESYADGRTIVHYFNSTVTDIIIGTKLVKFGSQQEVFIHKQLTL